MKKSQVFRVILFSLIFVVGFLVVQFYLTCPEDYRNNEWINGFFTEEEGALDAVYVGTSEVYTYFSPALAWDKYGIAVYNFTTNNQPFDAAKYILEECRKTQPDAVYIIDTKQLLKGFTFKPEKALINIHYLMDYWPTTTTKYKCMWQLLNNEHYKLNIYQKFEVLVPLYIYHDRWDEVTEQDISRRLTGLKGSSNYERWLNWVKPQEPSIVYDYGYKDIEDYQEEILRDLCQYCIDNDINVMFVSTPVCLEDVEKRRQYNTIGKIIQEYGLYYRDFNFEYDEIGIDFSQDYYDADHTNMYGAMKYTDYFSQILIDLHGFTDKRGQEGYETWDSAAERYREIIAGNLALNAYNGTYIRQDPFGLEERAMEIYNEYADDEALEKLEELLEAERTEDD